MALLPKNINPYEIENVLNKMFSPEWLRETSAKVGFVQRNRKIDPATFFWVVVLGFGVGMQRTLASLRRAYESASAESLVPFSFYDRFNNGLIAFLKECLTHGIADLASHTSLILSDKLKGFKDLIVADGTIIRLHVSRKVSGCPVQGRTQDTCCHRDHRQHQEHYTLFRQDR